jgi:non-ribosomal peptide synthetase component F
MTRAAYLPLDPVYPAERVGAMMHDGGVSAVITTTVEGLDARVADAARLAQAEVRRCRLTCPTHIETA